MTFFLRRLSSVLLQMNTPFFTSLAQNAAEFSVLFGRVKRQPQTWWSPKVKVEVSKRRKVSSALEKVEDRQAYISAS